MPTCFVIQPFDNGPFDKRYEDTLRPAIIAGGYEPYRVDRDASAEIPIDAIEREIRRSDVCLADISTDNPNVWFEVGFAIASRKSVVFVCAEARAKFPFDVQHRSIIGYKTESVSDFQATAEKVKARLEAVMKKNIEIADISELSPLANTSGLSTHEMVALIIIAENVDGYMNSEPIVSEMRRAGYENIAASLAIRSLTRKQYIKVHVQEDNYGNKYSLYEVADKGVMWLELNIDKVTLKKKPVPAYGSPPGTNEEIPF